MTDAEHEELIKALKTLRKHVGENQIDINFALGEIYFNDPDGAIHAHLEDVPIDDIEATVAQILKEHGQ